MFKTYQFGELFRKHGEAYINNFSPTLEQIKAIRSIRLCRTPALGGCEIVCKDCGNIHYLFNSCGNRSCPICQSLKQQIWLDKQKVLRLPVDYFHVIFTLPHELNDLIKVNQKLLYSALFKAA